MEPGYQLDGFGNAFTFQSGRLVIQGRTERLISAPIKAFHACLVFFVLYCQPLLSTELRLESPLYLASARGTGTRALNQIARQYYS